MARYPHAEWHGPVPNQSGARGTTTNRIVIHVMQGSLSGTDAWFHNPESQVSAHFGVGRDGECYQWVDTDDTAWAEAAYNGVAISIEHEGLTGESLTTIQLARSLALQLWILETYPSIPPLFVMNPAVPGGIIGHGQLGVPGGNHPDCPGMPILRQIAHAYAHRSPSKGNPVTIDTQRISSLLRQAAAIVAEVIAIGNQAHLPASVRGVLAGVGGILLSLEHFQSSPTPPAPKG
jgi:hypothetical protein